MSPILQHHHLQQHQQQQHDYMLWQQQQHQQYLYQNQFNYQFQSHAANMRLNFLNGASAWDQKRNEIISEM